MKSVTHLAFNGGATVQHNLRPPDGTPSGLDRAAADRTRSEYQRRISQADNGHEIDVYFNANDPLISNPQPIPRTNPANYELIRTTGTATEADDTSFHPTTIPITYDPTTGKAVLKFDPVGATPSPLDTPNLYRLRIGNSDPLALPPITITSAMLSNPPGSSFDTAASITSQYFNHPISGPPGHAKHRPVRAPSRTPVATW